MRSTPLPEEVLDDATVYTRAGLWADGRGGHAALVDYRSASTLLSPNRVVTPRDTPYGTGYRGKKIGTMKTMMASTTMVRGVPTLT